MGEIRCGPVVHAQPLDVHLWKKAIVFWGIPILMISISGLHVDLDQLQDEVTS